MPWNHHQKITASALEPTIEPLQSFNQAISLLACASSKCDCEAFNSWDEAQALLESAAGDPHSLDSDGDGEACERLR